MRSVLIKIVYIIIIPIIIYDLILISQTIVNNDETPDIFGIKTFSIISGSMSPTINVNDLIVVKKVPENEIKINDIISFKKDNDIITHRITDIKDIYNTRIYTTKGDNNETSDTSNVIYDQIEGKYLFKISKAGKIIVFLKNKVTFMIILVLLLMLYLFDRKKINKKIKRKEKRINYEKEKEEIKEIIE